MSGVFVFLNNLTDTMNIQTVQEEAAGSDIYIVLAVTLLVWLGVFFYLLYLDRRVKFLQEKIETYLGAKAED